MRAIAGPVMLLVVVLAFTGYRYMQKPEAPAREFTDLELSIPGHDGSCYALSTVLVANGIFGSAPRTWKRMADNEYQLTVERVIQGYGGPAREFSTWTFEKRGKAVELTAVEASQGQPQDPAASIEQLLEEPNERQSTPVDRCLKPGASGYLFQRK